jgi:hypothetical protein
VRAALEDSGTDELVLRPAAWVYGATEDGFEFQAATLGESGPVSPMLAPRQSDLIKFIPGDAAVFFSTIDIAETWEKVLKDARPQIDEAIREEGEYDSLDDALRDAGREIGVDSIEDVIRLLDGETVVAAWFPDGDEDNPDIAMVAQVDEAKARDILEKIVASQASGRPERRDVDSHEMTVFEDEDGEEIAYAFLEGNLVFGTPGGVEAVLANTESSLTSNEKYIDSVGQMPSALGTYLYLDLATVLRLASDGMVPELDEAERALEGLIINVVDERGVVRLSGIVTVAE